MSCKILILLVACTPLLNAQQRDDIGHRVASDLQAGKYIEARELVQRALTESPRDARLWTLDGLTLVRLGHEDEARTAFHRALEISPDYLPALEGAAKIEYERGTEDAALLLRKILKLRPDDRTSHAMLAALAFRQGDCQTAKNEYALSRSDETGEIGALQEFGSCLVKQKRTPEALPVFERLRELRPGNDKANYDLAVVQFLAGRYNNVIATLSPMVTRESPDPDALELLGEAYEAMSDTQRAMASLRQAVANNPNEARYYGDLGYLCLSHRDFQQGIDVLNAGLLRNPGAAPLYVARGILFSELAQYDKGEMDFKTAERLDPNVELVSEAHGLADLQQNNLPEAEKTVRERVRRHPDDAFLYYLLAEVLRRKGAAPGSAEFDEAEQSLRKALELKPQFGLARNVLGALYLEEGKTDDAIEQCRLAFRADPANETALYHLILALRKSNKTDEIPALLAQLVRLRKQTRMQESLEQKHLGIEQPPADQETHPVKQ